ncbi:MAG TPA: sodium:solute symporter [Saprospiraceae bacterium]|nr:sodium:solute symporter [Saprospiraceae bacterium]
MGLALVDWMVLIMTLGFIVAYGIYKTRGKQDMKSYIQGGKEAGWFTVGLSVMATQASAITFMSTPGQAFHDGIGFVQFYFGLPLAMIFISLFFLPIYSKLNIVTAYEYLETRFDNKTRALTASLFLLQRGLSAGITIYAPAIIMSTILGWDLKLLNFIMGTVVVIYTVSGGTKAVNVTHKQQMFVIMGGMFFAFFTIINLLPGDIGLTKALDIARISGKMNALDFSIDPNNRYTFWSGITGGFFLALSYFGTDQSQVQRYLSAKDEKQSRVGLIMNGLLKVPMQFFILLCGVMLFVFFQFNKAPVFFNTSVVDELKTTVQKEKVIAAENQLAQIVDLRTKVLLADEIDGAALQKLNQDEKDVRNEVKEMISTEMPKRETNDKDYVFIHFVLSFLPTGLIGLLLAVIFSAAMSSTASELNALASTTTMDLYRRNFNKGATDDQCVRATRIFTVMWGCIAVAFACFGTLFDNLIQFVNIVGSIFYGTVLGIFLSGFFFKQIKSNAVFIAAIITQLSIIAIFKADIVSYLWLNVIGAFGVILLSFAIGSFIPKDSNN